MYMNFAAVTSRGQTRLPRVRRTLATLILCVFVLGTAVQAVAAPEDEKTFKDWTVKCVEGAEGTAAKQCFMIQVVSDSKTDEPVLGAEIGYVPGQEVAVGQFTVPLGIFLPAGMQLKVDADKEIGRVPFSVCDPVGCRAVIPLNDKVLPLLKGGTVLKVIIASPDGRKATLDVSLGGFTAAFNSLK